MKNKKERNFNQIDYILEYIDIEELVILLINKIDNYLNYDSETLLNNILDEVKEDFYE